MCNDDYDDPYDDYDCNTLANHLMCCAKECDNLVLTIDCGYCWGRYHRKVMLGQLYEHIPLGHLAIDLVALSLSMPSKEET